MKTQLVNLTGEKTLTALEDTRYVVMPISKEGLENVLTLRFEKPGITCEIVSLFKLHSTESLNLTTIAHHIANNTSCNTKVKGVLFDSSSSTYIGKIIIEKSAQQTSSFLEDARLILGENTQNRSDPILEIEADDVSASHGATTGRVNPMEIYYLQSRGLSKKEAEEVIVSGFLESLISEITDETVKDAVVSLLK